MEFKAEHIAQFDAYLTESLSVEARLNFEQKLSDNPELAAEFKAYQLFEKDIVDAEVTAFQDQLKQWDKSKEKSPVKKGRIIPLKLIGLAASIAVILVVSILYFTGPLDNQELVALNFEAYDNILTVRGEKEDLDSGLMEYEAGAYKAAIDIFEKYPDDVNAQFYLGESLLAMNAYVDAMAAFHTVIESVGVFSEIAAYHLALAYLGNDDEVRAKGTLLEIEKESDYYTVAQELLGELK